MEEDDEFETQSALPETSELSKPKDLEMNPPVNYEDEEEEEEEEGAGAVPVAVESDENTSEFALKYWYKLKHEPIRTAYSLWKCTVHKVLIKVGQKLKTRDPIFVLCFKETWGRDYPNDWPGNDFKPDDEKRKEVDEGPDDELQNKKRKLQEEDASSDVAKSLSADSGASIPVKNDHGLIDGEWQYVMRIHRDVKVTELLVQPGMKVKKYQPLFDFDCEKEKMVLDCNIPLERLKQMAIKKGDTRFYSEKFGYFFDYVKPNGDPYEPV